MLSFVVLLSGAALVAGVALPSPQDQTLTTGSDNIPSSEDQQLRSKRGVYFAAAPVVHAAPIVAAPAIYHAPLLPTAVSSTSRFDIHKSGAIVHEPALLFRKKRGISYVPSITSYSATYPVATSHHEQTQVHNAALVHHSYLAPTIYHAPVAAVAPAAPVVHAAPVVAAAPAVLPVATSSSRRFQIHNNARIIQEYHEPLYAFAPAFAPVHAAVEEHHYLAQPAAVAPLAETVYPALPGAPVAAPAQISQQQLGGQQQEVSGAASAPAGGEGDSVTVDAARKAQ